MPSSNTRACFWTVCCHNVPSAPEATAGAGESVRPSRPLEPPQPSAHTDGYQWPVKKKRQGAVWALGHNHRHRHRFTWSLRPGPASYMSATATEGRNDSWHKVEHFYLPPRLHRCSNLCHLWKKKQGFRKKHFDLNHLF